MTDPVEAHAAEFSEVSPSGNNGDHLDILDLGTVPLGVQANLGTTRLSVREIIELKEGSVVPLDKLAGEMTTITVNDLPLARGEVVVLGDGLNVRIAEITGMSQGEPHVEPM